MTRPLALTQGDPAGIGPEIAHGAWAALKDELAFYLIGDAEALAARGNAPITRIGAPAEAAAVMPDALPVLHRPLPGPVAPGRPDPDHAATTVAAIETAVTHVTSGEAAALVTNPIAKKVLIDGAQFAFPGHTEFLAHLAGAGRAVMMLAAPGLRVVPATVHIALAEVPSRLTEPLLEETLRILHAALIRDFDIPAPRIAVAGLNPHAGEGGAMGLEEIEVIAPLIERLTAEGMALTGPLAADTLFHPAARARYDAALCMYHDQALIPLKTIDFAGGVNVTLGLPFIRTSPDHGTAFDIAGSGSADPTSLIAALRLAAGMSARRARA